MNRRRFLQFTIALAIAAPLAKLGVQPLGDQEPQPTGAPTEWIPTQAEVNEWMVYYKLAVKGGFESFAKTLERAFNTETVAQTLEDLELFKAGEKAFDDLHADRICTGFGQGMGYTRGRDGKPRYNPYFTGPSNEGFGWYFGWAVGNHDRERKLRVV
jgi:hypothetical protein